MGSTRSSKTSAEAAHHAGAVASVNPAEQSVGQGDAPSSTSDVVDEAFDDMEAKGEVVSAGMVRVRYNGRASVRGVSASDFANNDVVDHEDVEFNSNNRWTVAVSPAAADFLAQLGQGEFTRTPGDEMDTGDTAEAPRQTVPEFNVEPGAGGVALAMAPTPDSV